MTGGRSYHESVRSIADAAASFYAGTAEQYYWELVSEVSALWLRR